MPTKARSGWPSSRSGLVAPIFSAKARATIRCLTASNGAITGSPRAGRGWKPVFGGMAQTGGKLIRTIGQARGTLGNNDEGHLLSAEAAGLSPTGWRRGVLTHAVGRVAS